MVKHLSKRISNHKSKMPKLNFDRYNKIVLSKEYSITPRN